MAYTKNWIETDPVGSAITISQLDNSDRDIKIAVRERLEGDAADPLSGVLDTFSTLSRPKMGAGRFYCDDLGDLGTYALQDGRGYFTDDAGNSHPRVYSMETSGAREIAYLNRDGTRPMLGGLTVDIDVAGTQGSVDGLIVDIATAAVALTVTSMTGVTIKDPVKGAGSAITTLYGVKIENMTDGVTNYSIYTASGRVVLNDQIGSSAAAFRVWDGGHILIGKNNQTTGGTAGHVSIQSVAGDPTGTPDTLHSGYVQLLYDSTNNKLCVYNGAWKKTVALT